MQIIIQSIDESKMLELEKLAVSTFKETFGHLYTSDNLEHHLEKSCSAEFFLSDLAKGQHIDIAVIDGTLGAYIKYGCVGLPIDHNKDDAEIHRLYVTQIFQAQGIGKMLMNHALKQDHIQKAKRLFLGVWEHNLKAQNFYRGYGFEPVGEYIYYVGTHADREIIMQRLET